MYWYIYISSGVDKCILTKSQIFVSSLHRVLQPSLLIPWFRLLKYRVQYVLVKTCTASLRYTCVWYSGTGRFLCLDDSSVKDMELDPHRSCTVPFWRSGKRQVFPPPLCLILFIQIVIVIRSTIFVATTPPPPLPPQGIRTGWWQIRSWYRHHGRHESPGINTRNDHPRIITILIFPIPPSLHIL